MDRIAVAMVMPHNHPGIAGRADGDGCARCNAEHALRSLVAHAEDQPGTTLGERPAHERCDELLMLLADLAMEHKIVGLGDLDAELNDQTGVLGRVRAMLGSEFLDG